MSSTMLQYASVSWADVVDDDEEWRPDHWQQVQQQQQLNTTGGTTPRDQNLSVATVAQKEVATPSAADDATTPSVSPIKNDNSPPTPKRTVYQQVIVASPIPYTFKSLGSMSAAPLSPAHQQPTPNKQLQEQQQQQKQQQQQHPRPRPQQQQQQASSSKAKLAYATYWYHPTCYNYAVAELERALVEAGGELGYSDLMKACYWRARFQPTLGSLFTFLKKLKHKFAYKMTIVSLVGASAEEQQNLTASAPQVKQQQAAAVKEDPVSTPIVSELLTDWK